jgi:hypothetical protein
MQGQRSHLSQAKKCLERWQADLDTICDPNLPKTVNLFEERSIDDCEIVGTGEYQRLQTKA